MSDRPRWSYVQARLQARHGQRLEEADWHALETCRSADQFLERACASALRRFAAPIDPRQPSHAIERMIRERWRSYVAEVADWAPAAWRPAIVWVALLTELPIIDGLIRGEAPPWVAEDPVFAGGVGPDSPLRALAGTAMPEATNGGRWYQHWRALWPQRRAGEPALLSVVAVIRAHVERLGRTGLEETSLAYRRDLIAELAHLFRRHSGGPAAAFCHLALVALDLERLRGGLVRRRLFAADRAKEAA